MVQACLGTSHAPLETEDPPSFLENPHSWTSLPPPRPFNIFLMPQNREGGITRAFNSPSPFLGQGIVSDLLYWILSRPLIWVTLDRTTTIWGPWPARVGDTISPKCNHSFNAMDQFCLFLYFLYEQNHTVSVALCILTSFAQHPVREMCPYGYVQQRSFMLTAVHQHSTVWPYHNLRVCPTGNRYLSWC